jgi:hypothetical protein
VAGGGTSMPQVGLGTCCRAGERGPPITKAVLDWLRAGGELVDTVGATRHVIGCSLSPRHRMPFIATS